MKKKSKHKWKLKSGMIKDKWYIKVIANETDLEDV